MEEQTLPEEQPQSIDQQIQQSQNDKDQYKKQLYILGGLLGAVVVLGIVCYIVFIVLTPPA